MTTPRANQFCSHRTKQAGETYWYKLCKSTPPMQAIPTPFSLAFPAQVVQLKSTHASPVNVRTIDVYEPENLGLVVSGPLSSQEFDYIRAAYKKKLQLTSYPYLYLELHYADHTPPQQMWDELTDELKTIGDFYRIAVVCSATTEVDTGGLGAPGSIIRQFSPADAESAKRWLI